MISHSTKTFEAIYYVLMICRSRIKYILFEKLENRMYVLIMSHVFQGKSILYTQPAFISSKLAVKTLEQGVKYVQS